MRWGGELIFANQRTNKSTSLGSETTLKTSNLTLLVFFCSFFQHLAKNLSFFLGIYLIIANFGIVIY